MLRKCLMMWWSSFCEIRPSGNFSVRVLVEQHLIAELQTQVLRPASKKVRCSKHHGMWGLSEFQNNTEYWHCLCHHTSLTLHLLANAQSLMYFSVWYICKGWRQSPRSVMFQWSRRQRALSFILGTTTVMQKQIVNCSTSFVRDVFRFSVIWCRDHH